MTIVRFVACAFSVSITVFCPSISGAQEYPNKPIRIIMGQPGSGPDLVGRLIARGISPALGQQVIVDNRAGVLAIEAVIKAPPDGYTLLFFGPTAWLGPLLLSNVSWDPLRDLSTVTLAAWSPNILTVHPSMPVKSVKELIAFAKARPGELNYASGASGGSNHLAAELFKSMANVNIVRVPYKGSASAVVAVIGGETHLMFPDAGSGRPHIKSGKLRALAVTSPKPSELVPDVPTMAAAGLPGCESQIILGMFTPTKTPAAIVNLLNREVVRALHSAEAKERLSRAGMEAVGSSPVEFAATIRAETAKWGKLISEAGLR